MRYQRRREIVDATRYHVGLQLPGLRPRTAVLHLSNDGRFGYVTKDDLHPSAWMELQKRPGVIPDDKRLNAGFLTPWWAQFTPPDVDTYHRQVLSFNEWRVRADLNRSQTVDEHDEFFLDYAAMEKWGNGALEPCRTALLTRTFQGTEKRDIVRIGDWIITHESGQVEVLSEQDFQTRWEPCPQTLD